MGLRMSDVRCQGEERVVRKIPGLGCKISDEDLFSDDSALWEACSE